MIKPTPSGITIGALFGIIFLGLIGIGLIRAILLGQLDPFLTIFILIFFILPISLFFLHHIKNFIFALNKDFVSIKNGEFVYYAGGKEKSKVNLKQISGVKKLTAKELAEVDFRLRDALKAPAAFRGLIFDMQNREQLYMQFWGWADKDLDRIIKIISQKG